MMPIIWEILRVLVIALLEFIIQTLRRKRHEKKVTRKKKEQSNVQQKCGQETQDEQNPTTE